MDAAKLVSVLKGANYTIRDLLENPSLARKQIPTVMVPTTCGTGAEATCNAIVAIPEEQSKKGIVNDDMIPDYVILEPKMIERLPKAIVAATGVDALAHVVECYTSKKATLLSNTFAREGAKLIFANIRKAYEHPEDMEAKEKMMLGAYYGRNCDNSQWDNCSACVILSIGRKVSYCARCFKCNFICTCDGI